MEADNNPLYFSSLTAGCVGATCETDLNKVSFTSSSTVVYLDYRATAPPATCDSTTCLDLGGFCDAGGYANSIFIYQWVGSSEVRTDRVCDEFGRFNVQVKVPLGFSWEVPSATLRLYMKVIDENGTELKNETGKAELLYTVSIRK